MGTSLLVQWAHEYKDGPPKPHANKEKEEEAGMGIVRATGAETTGVDGGVVTVCVPATRVTSQQLLLLFFLLLLSLAL